MNKYQIKKTLVISIIILFIGTVFIPIAISENIHLKNNSIYLESSAFNPFLKGWNYRKKITINNTKIENTLTNFPVLISIFDTDLRDKAQGDGDDILFMDDKGFANSLYHEIEKYDASTGELVAWVNIPSLSSSKSTFFYMYYGNPDSGNQQIPENVWDPNYVMVQHMNNAPGYYQIFDSTSYNNDGIKGGNHPMEIDSKIGKGQYFVENGYIDISFSSWYPELGGMSSLTIEAWVKPHSTSSDYHMILSAYRPVNMYYFSFGGWQGDNWLIKLCGSSGCQGIYFGPPKPATGIWYYVVATWDGYKTRCYIDGDFVTDRDSTHGSVVNTGTQVIRIGAENSNYGEYLVGEITELRISDTDRSSAWIKTSYNNQNYPSGFMSFGPEEPRTRGRIDYSIFYYLQKCFNIFQFFRLILKI